MEAGSHVDGTTWQDEGEMRNDEDMKMIVIMLALARVTVTSKIRMRS